jgi:alpha-L-fucosidase
MCLHYGQALNNNLFASGRKRRSLDVLLKFRHFYAEDVYYLENSIMLEKHKSEIVIPTPEQAVWAEAEIGVLFHYDMQIFNPEYEITQFGTHPDPRTFAPTSLDTDQWIKGVCALGAQYAILTAKHGCGFSLWPTEAHDYSVKNSPWKNGKGDIVRDFIASCKKYGVKPGIYANTTQNGYLYVDNPGLVQPGSPVTQEEYNRIVIKQLTELWSNYGELFEIWFDGGVLSPDKGGLDVLPLIQRLQPKAIAFQGPNDYPNIIRWVGNELGTAPYPCWATAPSTTNADGTTEIRGLNGDPDAPYWCPGEADFPLRGHWDKGWMWYASQKDRMYTLDELMVKYETSVGRNTNMLLGVVIDPRGLIPEPDMIRLAELGAAIKKRYGSPLKSRSGTGNEVSIVLDTPAAIDRLVIQEDITLGERVLEYRVTGNMDDGWVELSAGTNIGHRHIDTFPSRLIKEIKLEILKSKANPRIKNFAVFETLTGT